MKSIKDFDVKNKRVLVRCDFNIPLDDEGNILNDFRIKESLPTIKYLSENGAKIILMSHLGDPEGKVTERYRLDGVHEKLIILLNQNVGLGEKPIGVLKTDDCIGEEIRELTENINSGEVLLLENLRFHKEEEENDEKFAKELAKLGDIYINDAFGVCHRKHASVSKITKSLPHGAGFLLEKEILVLKEFLKHPQKPVISIIGGKKVETKAKLIDKLSDISDFVLLGGPIKGEIYEKHIKLKHSKKIVEALEDPAEKDLFEDTIKLFEEKIQIAKTIFWNGPLGQTEDKNYQEGTKKIIQAIIKSGAFSIVGGGETVEFIQELGLGEKFNHLSTGGGAMLSFLSGEKLPGLEALR